MFIYWMASFQAVFALGLFVVGTVQVVRKRAKRYVVLAVGAALSGAAFLGMSLINRVMSTVEPDTVGNVVWAAGKSVWAVDASFNRMLRGGNRPDPVGLDIAAVFVAIVLVVLVVALIAPHGKVRLQRIGWALAILGLVVPPVSAREATLAAQRDFTISVQEGVRQRAKEEHRLFAPPFKLVDGRVEVETVYSEAGFITSLVFAPDGELFMGERTGTVRRAAHAGATVETLATFDAAGHGEGGLIAMALDPNYPRVPHLYVYYTEAGFTRNRLARIDVGTTPVSVEYVLDDLPAALYHNGGGMAFGDDGAYYLAVGETSHLSAGRSYEHPPGLQSVNDVRGKILRLNKDGTPAPGNPIEGNPVYALGFRSPFRLIFDPISHSLMVAENGPHMDDEINVIKPLKNYGYPLVTGPVSSTRFEDPLLTASVPIGISGMVVLSSDVYGEAGRGDVFFCGWNSGFLFHLPIERRFETLRPAGPTRFYRLPEGSYCRLDLVQGPDGYLYASDVGAVHRITKLDVQPVPTGEPPSTAPNTRESVPQDGDSDEAVRLDDAGAGLEEDREDAGAKTTGDE